MRIRGLTMRILFFLAACSLYGSQVLAQESGPNRQSPDVVRVNTSLIQTDVMVFDNRGNFVDGLKREQFVLKVDGKPRDISFFERVLAGSRNEEAQLAAARGTSPSGPRLGNAGPVPLDRGRTVFFFVDDIHMSVASMTQTKVLLESFLEREMGQNDEAAIASSSGQIGFLQQLTDDQTVLRAATARLMPRSYMNKDSGRPPMSEYQAQLIENENEDVLDYFVDELVRATFNLPRNLAAEEVRGRASQIVQEGNFMAGATLNSLKALVKNSAGLPGRKIIFMISDGFFLDNKNSDSHERLREVTAAATASGVIIYSIDARGLAIGLPDASTEAPFDTSGRLSRATGGEMSASQDVLSALAADTGGRAFLNNNNLSAAVKSGLKETSAYYLLAWRPETEQQPGQKPHRIEVNVSGRPDLVVRFHRGFGDAPAAASPSQKKKEGMAPTKTPNELIAAALRAPYPGSELPVAISLHFLEVAQAGATLTTSVKVSTSSLVLDASAGLPVAEMDVAGGVFDDQGKAVSSFNKHLTIKSKSGDPKAAPPENIFYNHFCVIKPGLYQVRVAALDPKQGRIGTAVRWIEVPDVGSKALTLSSLIVGERKTDSASQPSTANESETGRSATALQRVALNVDHHFASSSMLRFLTFIYNAAGTASAFTTLLPAATGTSAKSLPAMEAIGPANGPDLAVQVQIFRDNEPIITAPLHKIQVEGASDPRRLPYAAEVSLENLPAGRYVLSVTVIDRLARTSASQKFGFRVD
jgi:VWFA-related protein